MIYAMNSHDAQLLTYLGCWDKWLAQQGIDSTLCSAVWRRSYFLRQIFNKTGKSNLSGPDRGSARGLTKFI